MRRRPEHISPWDRVLDTYAPGAWVFMFIVTIFGWVVVTIGFASIVGEQNDVREGQFKVVHALEDHKAGRSIQEIAQSLLVAHENKFGASELDHKDFRVEVERSAQTGELPTVLTPKRTWDDFLPSKDDYLTCWLSLGIAAMLVFFSIGISLIYANEVAYEYEFLIDMKWQTSHVVFVLFTPLLWVSYLVSFVCLRKFKLEQAQAQAERERRQANNQVAERTEPKKPVKTFVDDREGALEAYYVLRTQTAQSHVEQKRETLQARVLDLKTTAHSLGVKMRETQQASTKAKADLRALDEIKISDALPTRETIATQFERIVNLPGVIKIWPINKGLGMLVEARVEHSGTLYDIGDWELSVTMTGVRGHEARSGVRSDWKGSYPVYRYGRGEFCFGRRQYQIDDWARSGDLLEAAVIAIESLNSVNPEDRKKIPKAFKKASDKKGTS
jgi:uncharacterized membrane protein YciS (DUF1049 family)